MLSSRNINNAFNSGRPRSGTTGSKETASPEPQTAPPVLNATRSRPSHLRSRSYLSSLSPVDPKPRNAMTMPHDVGRDKDRIAAESLLAGHTRSTGRSEKDALKGKDKDGNESGTSSAASLLPRLHLSGHHNKRKSQDLRIGTTFGSADVSSRPWPQQTSKPQSQLHLQHLGLNLPVPLKRAHSHRHTKSEIPRSDTFDSTSSGDGLLHPYDGLGVKGGMLSRMASNLSSRNLGAEGRHHQHHHKPHHQYSASDFQKNWNNAAMAVHPSLHGARPGVRRRATSDPRSPSLVQGHVQNQGQYGNGLLKPEQETRLPMTEVEILLYKAEKARQEAEENVTEADVQKLTTQLAESNVELQTQLGDANRSAQSLMRRLDDAHDNLVNTASSLIDTISSFQNLCAQSDQLIKNFENKTEELDSEMRKALEKHRNALFEKRGKKISQLEDRGQKANDRAEEMSRRLENCRTIIRNFADREQTKRRAWKGVLVGSAWGAAIIAFGILVGVAMWWCRSYAYLESHELVHQRLQHNGVPEDILQHVPVDVRAVLNDIAHRHNASYAMPGSKQPQAEKKTYTRASNDHDVVKDKSLEKLFDKLDL
ncbi:hypothetical protein LTR05_003422 [Lithohypha guttulata]|uniref:Uncharacterized protein n=1 Tax=Lithohypha guttulata TaxID=1690604 RepID=A0AAN7T3R6_9EURO|nr:hypothetical protein LTR05_003422 [Lithohypha guttulata]